MTRHQARVDLAFVLLTVAVASTTAAFPFVAGYGTTLFQVVVLGAWSVVSSVTSDGYADNHHGAVYAVALGLNVVAFWLVAAPVWILTRRHRPVLGVVGLVGIAALYAAALFWLFPAHDGP